MSRCLVTGGAGFIGSNLVDALIENGHKVAIIDNESAESNEKFYWNKKAEHFKINILNRIQVEGVFRNFQPEWIFHLAAESRIQPTIDNPTEACSVNFMGTAFLLDLCRKFEIEKFIFSSTSASYGLKNKPPLKEDMKPDCLNAYSVSKVASENLCKIYYDLYGLKTIVFRYFNIYGKRQPLKGQYAPVVGLFLEQKKRSEPLTIVGDGSQSRDFTHVDDVIRANILAAETKNKNAFGEIFNVGTGEESTVLELATKISDNITYIPSRPGEAQQTLADITKAKEILNWEAKKSLENYIKENI